MENRIGEHHWVGAQLAADEINDAGGIMVGSQAYGIELVKIDSNELVSVSDASSAVERAITVDEVDFLMGGIWSEAVAAMQDVAMDHNKIFLGCGASAESLCTNVVNDYERYKYWFRVSPINGTYLTEVALNLLGMVADKVSNELDSQPNVAIIAENLSWADTVVSKATEELAAMDIQVADSWRPLPNEGDLTPQLSSIEASEANIILTAFSGSAGITYAKQWTELQIPAASVGINLEAQSDDFGEATGGKGNYECTIGVYTEDLTITDKTVPFVQTFIEEAGGLPTYCAATYDAVYILKDAIEAAESMDANDIVIELEKTDYIGTSGRIVFTDSHDLTWGPGFVTSIGVQWQDGQLKGVWPPYDGSWQQVAYEGTVDYKLPPWVLDR
jgi:branched-chain amino acid transport system substrate-binding protein